MTGDQAVDAAVDRIAELLGEQIGLRPQSNLRGRLRRCVVAEAAARNQDVLEYVETLALHRNASQSLINKITVQESSFFRHREHFEVLVRDVLPTLSRPVSIWCAGCGNGQEAFSLAMTLEEAHVEGVVYATDLSTDALARVGSATYSTRELGGLGAERVGRHFDRTEHGWTVRSPLRARVRTAAHNLMDALPPPATACQVIFCRNVLIYFSPEGTRAFLDRVADAMPAAVVFLGAAETMWSSSDRFRTVQAGDAYYYRPPVRASLSPRAPAGAPRPSPPPARSRRPEPLLRRELRVVEAPVDHTGNAEAAALVGRLALEAGDHRAAVVAFRKCAYLTPDDALAHLHLGLALEASGDHSSARRAFATAQRTILQSAEPPPHHALGGYAPGELLRLLDTKQKELAP